MVGRPSGSNGMRNAYGGNTENIKHSRGVLDELPGGSKVMQSTPRGNSKVPWQGIGCVLTCWRRNLTVKVERSFHTKGQWEKWTENKRSEK